MSTLWRGFDLNTIEMIERVMIKTYYKPEADKGAR
jgi:hypothetical protein